MTKSNMKKVIYINYIKQYGHINFDKIHINALVSQGYDVKIIMHKDIANKLPYSKEIYALVLPTWMGYSSKNGIINRLVYIATLLFIKFKISFKSYNYCIISNLDEISMALCPLTKDMFLICHGNSKNFTNAIKKIFLHKLALSCTFIVFNNQMAKPFLKNGITCIRIISHGCVAPFVNMKVHSEYAFMKKYKHIIFHPSSKTDVNFVNMIYNENVNKSLKENETLLVLRNNPLKDKKMSNIIFINKYLNNMEYQYLFSLSEIILLAYPSSFHYQVSGVSFECISNNKKLLALRNESLIYCGDFYNYDPFFNNADNFINKIIYLNKTKNSGLVITPQEVTPNYKVILK